LSGWSECPILNECSISEPIQGRLGHASPLFHNHAAGNKPCPAPATYIPLDAAEEVVLQSLFSIFGNPTRMAEAVRDGMPDQGKVGELTARRDRALKNLERVQKERRNIAVAIREGLPVDKYLKEQVDILDAKETTLRELFEEAAQALGDVPSVEEVEARPAGRKDRHGRVVVPGLRHAIRRRPLQFRWQPRPDVRLRARREDERRQFRRPSGLYVPPARRKTSRRRQRQRHDVWLEVRAGAVPADRGARPDIRRRRRPFHDLPRRWRL
jgi:hypothetical protein